MNMNDILNETEITLKSVCCTCLSFDRKLTQLCRVENGVNNLFFLFSYKSEDYEKMLCKDVTKLFICWECTALMKRLCKFKDQAWAAQKQLLEIADGKINNSSKIKCLSKLSNIHQTAYTLEIVTNYGTTDNFVNCGPLIEDIKVENDPDDIPLSELNDVEYSNEHNNEQICMEKTEIKCEIKQQKVQGSDESNFKTIHMSEKEMLESIETRKLMQNYLKALWKCVSCVITFKDYNESEKHNLEVHKQRPKYIQCDICKAYMKSKWLPEHRNGHYEKYECELCTETCYTMNDIKEHLKNEHSLKTSNTGLLKTIRKGYLKTSPKSKRKKNMTDDPKPLRYMCTECNKYFENKNMRYKHVQIYHKEGFKCSTCGKSFPFKYSLTRHEQIHRTPLPREQCPICGKMIRKDLMKNHVRIHTERRSFSCISCDKRFVSRASYEHHLKYTRSHAVHDILKYKCSMCDKDYRSPGELRDHINYQHMGKTRHKCPVCDKALATRRCIIRHVRRAHHGLKENARDKICQTCGKVFREKKCLREHELIHTGERPLSCDICGRTFRQSAALYTHRRRVHNVAPKQKVVEHTDDNADDTKQSLMNSELNVTKK